MKLEQKNIKKSVLKHEASIYKFLSGVAGFPHFHWYGVEGDYNVLVIELLGRNLESLLQLCEGKFSPATTLVLAKQMVTVRRTVVGASRGLSRERTRSQGCEA